eukprot:559137-Alexandrium_andersonii.AAC.1
MARSAAPPRAIRLSTEIPSTPATPSYEHVLSLAWLQPGNGLDIHTRALACRARAQCKNNPSCSRA